MVDGDLDVNGGFSWYGVVLVSGMVKYTGGGGKNVTGGVVSGDSMMNLTDESVTGGGTNIVYCSSAVNNLTQNSPLPSQLEGEYLNPVWGVIAFPTIRPAIAPCSFPSPRR